MDNLRRNFYCDESCHLEHDKSQYMILGMVYCLNDNVKKMNEEIKNIKLKNSVGAHSEVKWSKLSNCNFKLYKELIEFFLDRNNGIFFRAVIIDKKILKHEKLKQSHEDFYYKMYYYLLQYKIDTLLGNKIYLDEKDTHNAERVRKLEEILRNKFHDYNKDTILPIQVVKSHEIQLMQITDILIGAVSYCLNNKLKKNNAKVELIKFLEQEIGHEIPDENNFHGLKCDLFYFKKGAKYE